jgi:transcriptional regulator with XRE-family HTH domain
VFGERVRKYRKLKGLTQEELGKLCNVTKASVSKWENAENMPETSTLNVLSKVLEVSLDYLYGKTDDPEGKIVETVIDGIPMQLTFDEKIYYKKYPNGLTPEHFAQVLKLLDQAGFTITKKETIKK